MKTVTSFLIILILSFSIFAAGEVDLTFNASAYTTNTVNSFDRSLYSAMALQPDGKLILGGSFSVVNGLSRSSIVRFNQDGSVDAAFNPPDLIDGFDNQNPGLIYSIVTQSNGKIIVGGIFGVTGTTYRHLIRLNSDGTLDTTFKNFAEQFRRDQYIKEIAVRADDSIYIAGVFNLPNINSTSSNVALLNSNGELDPNSQFQINQPVYAIALAPNNSIYVATQFSGNTLINRYNSNGSVDNSFTQVVANQQVFKMLIQPDGSILVGGAFTSLNGFSVSYLGRITPEGAVDVNFRPRLLAGGVLDIAFSQDGKIIVVGAFAGDAQNTTQTAINKFNLDGTRDTTFTSPFTTLGFVVGVRIQQDGKILLSGGRVNVIRINANGTLDNSYAPIFIGLAGVVYEIVQQSDGKIIAGGSFNRAGNVTSPGIVRYNVDGTVDNTFNFPFSNFSQSITYKIILQPDGKILIGGLYVRDADRRTMYRLNQDGSIDNTFFLGFISFEPTRDFELLTDGKIIVNGTTRLLPNGAVDNTYASQTLTGTVLTTYRQPDGKLLIGGTFTQVGPFLRGRIARLNADGTIDNTFAPPQGANADVNDIELQSDGKIILVGAFTSLNGNTTKSFIGRLNSDGSLDASFSPVVDKTLWTVKVQPTGKILIGGTFSIVNGAQRNRYARLNPDGNLDPSFTSTTGANGTVYKINLQTDDKILIGGAFSRINGIPAIGLARLLNATTLTRTMFDFDGDRRADVSVFRPSNGFWYQLRGTNNTFFALQFGQAGDRIAPADYDGDGKTDIAVFRDVVPGAGNSAYFYITRSSDNSFVPVQFGATGDVPVSGDWDGDGKDDLAVYRDGSLTSGQSFFYYRPSSQPTVNFNTIPLGVTGDKPLVGDFDGDGRIDPAVFRPSTATWIILKSSVNQIIQIPFGLPTDIPAPADFNGDGMANLAVFRPSNGFWYIARPTGIASQNFDAVQFGLNGDRPVPADYDGDGKADVAVFRPSNGSWYILRSTEGLTGVQFGTSEDRPIPNAYIY